MTAGRPTIAGSPSPADLRWRAFDIVCALHDAPPETLPTTTQDILAGLGHLRVGDVRRLLITIAAIANPEGKTPELIRRNGGRTPIELLDEQGPA